MSTPTREATPGSRPGTPFSTAKPIHRRADRLLDRAPVLVSRIATLLGLLALLDAMFPRRLSALYDVTKVMPMPARTTADALVLVSGVLLLRIAHGLRQRKRGEWQVAVLLCVMMLVADLAGGERRPAEAGVTLLLLALLLSAHRRFTARPDPRSRWFALRVGVQFLGLAFAYGLVLLALPGRAVNPVSFGQRVKEVALSLVGLGGTVSGRSDRFSDLFHATLLVLGLLTLVSVVFLALRPVEPIAQLSPSDEQQIRDLLLRHGRRDSLGYFALRRDKSVIWSPTGKAAITYRVVAGVALVSGDPIGDPEAWPGAIDAFRRVVDEYGWTPAVTGCSETGATIFRREYGLRALGLGDECVVTTADFSLNGRSMRGVRQACTRVTRAGYTATVRRVRDVDSTEMAQLRDLASAWRGDAVERGYSMALSRLGDPADPDCVIVVVQADGEVRGLLHFVPWGNDGLSLDLMRRDRDSDNGLNEFMIATLLQAAPAMGIERVSLNFVMFRDALERGERIGAGPVLRIWRRLLLLASRWWQIDSLYRFNAKFRPAWEPRFICYPAARDLPRISWASLEAEAFIVRPRRLVRLLGRTG